KAYSNGKCFNISGQEYKQWLSGVIKWTRENNPENQQYIYINAWNEWGEGAILEPTTRYGYKNLELTKQGLEE
ncbi:MAG: glycoside hydrolase family 99-like domain-containing protein, partial [Alphaproteobacteria bacterium]|nr:glycoside hydrolase family 99-like domain-containing protein [Alphaproteobacteria bacterium]